MFKLTSYINIPTTPSIFSLFYPWFIESYIYIYIYLQSVAQKSERIADEEVKCQHMADLAQSDLNEALPALEEAIAVIFYILHPPLSVILLDL